MGQPLHQAQDLAPRPQLQTGKLKVNDHDGNPIEIAAVVVWRVVDTSEALFEVDDYENYVQVQSESAVRHLASRTRTTTPQDDEMPLRGEPGEIPTSLRTELQERLEQAGVEVMRGPDRHLAYAPEIANAMLRRQQAAAVVAARQRIVEGAVGMVEMALEQLGETADRRARRGAQGAMVSNLLVVLCTERTRSRWSTPARSTRRAPWGARCRARDRMA